MTILCFAGSHVETHSLHFISELWLVRIFRDTAAVHILGLVIFLSSRQETLRGRDKDIKKKKEQGNSSDPHAIDLFKSHWSKSRDLKVIVGEGSCAGMSYVTKTIEDGGWKRRMEDVFINTWNCELEIFLPYGKIIDISHRYIQCVLHMILCYYKLLWKMAWNARKRM